MKSLMCTIDNTHGTERVQKNRRDLNLTLMALKVKLIRSVN